MLKLQSICLLWICFISAYSQVTPTYSLNNQFRINVFEFVPATIVGNIYYQSSQINFSPAFSQIPSMQPFIGLILLNINSNQNFINFDIQILNITQTGFSFNITIQSVNNNIAIKFNYLVTNTNFNNSLCFTNILFKNHSGAVANYTLIPIDLTSKCNGMTINNNITIVQFLYSISYNDSANQNDIKLITTVINSTLVHTRIFTWSVTLTINSIRYSIAIFDKQRILQSTNYLTLFSYNNLSYTAGTVLSHISFPLVSYLSINVVIGLVGYDLISTSNRFNFYTSIGSNTTINFGAQMDYYFLNFGQIFIGDISCSSASYPYLQSSSLLCTSSCNTNQYLNVSTCLPCQNNCLTCSSQTTCTSCNNGSYLLSNNSCKLCPASCASCLNSFVCTNCTSNKFYNPNNNLCYSYCGLRYFNNNTIWQCQMCHYSCLDCIDSTSTGCISCSNSSDRRVLLNSSCIPIDGYYENFTRVAVKCNILCSQCTNSTFCTSCINTYYLSAFNTCQKCPLECSTCLNTTFCTDCSTGYTLNAATHICQCKLPSCALCQGVPPICIGCINGIKLVNGVCLGVCGDGLLQTGEECDYLNVKYGCSKECKQQVGFNCSNVVNPFFNTSNCYYLSPFSISIIKTFKQPTQNLLSIQLQITPAFSTLDQVNLISMLSLNISQPFSSFDYNPNTGQVTISYLYNQTIENVSAKLTFNPTSVDMFKFTPATNVQFTIQSQNNLGLQVYPQLAYTIRSLVVRLSWTIVILAWFIMLISLLFTKLIGVELMAVIQISFFGLISMKSINPPFSGLLNLRYSNGYTQMFGYNPFSNKVTPLQSRGIYLFGEFMLNYNVMMIGLMVCLVGGFGYKIASKLVSQSFLVSKFERISRMLFWEYGFSFVMLGGYMMGSAMSMHIQYSMSMNGVIGYVSMIEMVVMVIWWVMFFMGLIMKPEYFGQYSQYLQEGSMGRYYNWLMIERVCLGLLLVMMMAFKYELMIAMGVMLLQLIAVILKRHYIHRFHNVRVIINLLASMSVLAIYQLVRVQGQQAMNSSLGYYMPVIVCGILIVCVVFNLIFLVLEIYRVNNWDKINKKMIEDEDKEKLKEFIQARQISQLNSQTIVHQQSTHTKQSIHKKQAPFHFLLTNQQSLLFTPKMSQKQEEVLGYDQQYDNIS